MRRQTFKRLRLGSGMLALSAILGLAGAAMSQALHAPYSRDRPLPTAVRFDIPNAVSADDFWHVWHNTFTPDGKTMYFMSAGGGTEVIMETHFLSGKWSAPEVAPFSGLYWMESPSISPDGLHFFFSKLRSPMGLDVMVMDKVDTGWSEPRSVGASINAPGSSPCFAAAAASGNLYFASDREGGLKLFCSKWSDGGFGVPEKLSDAVNSGDWNAEPAIAPDESFLIFASSRAGGLGHVDLYISLKKDGSWTPARNLGPRINSSAYDGRPCISPDGRYLFLTSSRGFADRPLEKPLTYQELLAQLHGPESGRMNIYQVDISAVHSE